MRLSRVAHIPNDYVIAEFVAHPLASVDAFASTAVMMDPSLDCSTTAGRATWRLWRSAESRILGALPGFSVDEGVAIRDQLWFGNQPNRGNSVTDYVLELADRHLAVEGDELVAVAPDYLSDEDTSLPSAVIARNSLMWLSLSMPIDVLCNALIQRRCPGLSPKYVGIAPRLAQILSDRGFAEPHLHLGAALDFRLFWQGMIVAGRMPSFNEDALQSPGAEMDNGKQLARLLLNCLIARYILASFLEFQSSGLFAEFVATVIPRRLSKSFASAVYPIVMESLQCLSKGVCQRKRRFVELRWAYQRLMGHRTTDGIECLDALLRRDDVYRLLRANSADTRSGEDLFVQSSIAYLQSLERAKRRDELFELLFWQIMRIRGIFYRHIVHRPMTPGLQWFIRFFSRLKPIKKYFSAGALVNSAERICGVNSGLRSLEVRFGPERSYQGLRRLIGAIDNSARQLSAGHPELEFGAVIHFTKDRGGSARQGAPAANNSGSYGRPNPARIFNGMRYRRYFDQRAMEALHLERLFLEKPCVLELICGVDVCTDELGIPNWVLAPIFKRLTAAATMSIQKASHFRGRRLSRFKKTAHCGEDFVHLTTGLRNLSEAVDGFDLREGDRIGHGLALGVDPIQWARRAGRLPIARETRLFDLVWQNSGVTFASLAKSSHPARHLQKEICAHSEEMFAQFGDHPPDIGELESLREDLYDTRKMFLVGYFNDGWPLLPIASDRRTRILHYFLTSNYLFHKGNEIIWTDPSAEAELMTVAQNLVRKKLGTIGITVEVNPTSNLLIGDLGDLSDHPLWRLSPPRAIPNVHPMAICIGSDDPILFSSRLPLEYQRLFDAMIAAGVLDEEAHRWLDRTRSIGIETRFTRRLVPGESISDLVIDDPNALPLRGWRSG